MIIEDQISNTGEFLNSANPRPTTTTGEFLNTAN